MSNFRCGPIPCPTCENTEELLSVECPTCGAAVGERCVSRTGRTVYPGHMHRNSPRHRVGEDGFLPRCVNS